MATKSIAWNTGSGNITLTYQGQGDGPISVVSDANDGSARSQTITIQTTKGGLITKNVTVSQAACPVPVGTVLNYAYTGSYQEVELPAGQYKLQCWGAQGGSNGTNSSYGITAKAGGKGGYSEGILTLSQKTTVRVYVGGQGSASAGGFNGGGSTTGTSQYNSGNEFGYSKMGGGGGATDIRLSDGNLLSRMIVAGGGSGGAMCYKKVTTSSSTSIWPSTSTGTTNIFPSSWVNGSIYTGGGEGSETNRCRSEFIDINGIDSSTGLYASVSSGWNIEVNCYDENQTWLGASGWISSGTVTISNYTRYIKLLFRKTDNASVSPSDYSSVGSLTMTYSQNWVNNTISNIGVERYDPTRVLTNDYIDINGVDSFTISANSGWLIEIDYYTSGLSWISGTGWQSSGTYTPPSNARYVKLLVRDSNHAVIYPSDMSSVGSVYKNTSSTTTSTKSQVGYYGGGESAGGHHNGDMLGPGRGGGFGYGADQSVTSYRYVSGAGGGGWNGGGCNYSDSDMSYVQRSGGGNGFVNISAYASYRPSGYTGLQLDSGELKDGSQTFKAPNGNNETGHSGNGYARITRLS